MQEGPEVVSIPIIAYFCTGCKWFRITGNDRKPILDCTHPNWGRKSLGGDARTPGWCPYIINNEVVRPEIENSS